MTTGPLADILYEIQRIVWAQSICNSVDLPIQPDMCGPSLRVTGS